MLVYFFVFFLLLFIWINPSLLLLFNIQILGALFHNHINELLFFLNLCSRESTGAVNFLVAHQLEDYYRGFRSIRCTTASPHAYQQLTTRFGTRTCSSKCYCSLVRVHNIITFLWIFLYENILKIKYSMTKMVISQSCRE